MFSNWQWWRLPISVKILKSTGLYALNEWTNCMACELHLNKPVKQINVGINTAPVLSAQRIYRTDGVPTPCAVLSQGWGQFPTRRPSTEPSQGPPSSSPSPRVPHRPKHLLPIFLSLKAPRSFSDLPVSLSHHPLPGNPSSVTQTHRSPPWWPASPKTHCFLSESLLGVLLLGGRSLGCLLLQPSRRISLRLLSHTHSWNRLGLNKCLLSWLEPWDLNWTNESKPSTWNVHPWTKIF